MNIFTYLYLILFIFTIYLILLATKVNAWNSVYNGVPIVTRRPM